MMQTPSVGYLGPKGTYSHLAALRWQSCLGKADLIGLSSILELVKQVLRGQIDHGVVPIENSLEGALALTLDFLYQNPRLRILGEIVLEVEHCLLARKGTKQADIGAVLSHPHALAQCRRYLQRELPAARLCPVPSTAEACRRVALDLASAAAVAGRQAASFYDLEILAEGIQEQEHNQTRFIAVGLTESPRTGCDKTTCLFTTDNHPGALHQILGAFASRNVNMTWLQSRPSQERAGEYVFFVDLQGHIKDDRIKEALAEIRRSTRVCHVLGSYPAAQGSFRRSKPSAT